MSVKSEKKRFIAACAVLSVLIVGLAAYGLTAVKKPVRVAVPPAMETAAPAGVLPEVTFFDEKGDSVQLEDFRGRVILVNLWATWCTPCVAELPALDALQSKMKDRPFEVVAISMDRSDMAKISQFLAERKIENIVSYWDRDRAIASKWSYAGLPVSFLIDAEGQVVERFNGPREWDGQQMLARIEAIVK